MLNKGVEHLNLVGYALLQYATKENKLKITPVQYALLQTQEMKTFKTANCKCSDLQVVGKKEKKKRHTQQTKNHDKQILKNKQNPFKIKHSIEQKSQYTL